MEYSVTEVPTGNLTAIWIDVAATVLVCVAIVLGRSAWSIAITVTAGVLTSTLLGVVWAALGNWTTVIVTGFLAAYAPSIFPAVLSFLTAVSALLPLSFVLGRSPLSDMIPYYLLVVLAAVVSAAFGLVVRQMLKMVEAEERLHSRNVALAKANTAHEISRGLHDSVAHELAGIVVIAQAAQKVDSPSPSILSDIEKAGTRALNSLRDVVSSNPRAPQATSAQDLEDIFKRFQGNITVDVSTDAPAPQIAALAAVAREALTNILRHSPGASVTAEVTDVDADHVVMTITNSHGTSSAGLGPGSGLGLHSMKERCAAAGGTFTAGPTNDGWQVRAVLPHHPSLQEKTDV